LTVDPARARVLVVDDHPEVLRLIQRLLERSYVCDVASTTGEAREKLARESFELVLCDVYLAGESGLILAEEIVREFRRTSVVLITAEDDPEVARRAFEFGAHGYLVKPFGRGQLLITTMNALKRRQLELAQQAHARTLREQLQAVIDRAPMPIYAKDHSFRYIMANRSAEENARLGTGELIGLTDEAFMSPDSAERARQTDRRVLDGGEVCEEQETLLIAGEQRTYLTVKFPLLDHGGEIQAVCGVSPDVTARKQADQLRDELANAQAQAIQDLRSSRLETVERLAKALELHDPNLGQHVDRMAAIAAFLARLLGLDAELVRAAAAMHDVGKIGLPAEIVRKAEALTSAERTEMQRHAQLGYELLSGSESELLHLAATIALTHHERFDGSGYPRGLAGEAIPLEGRIAALADVFDALLDDRTYRPALTVPEAVELIRDGTGTHFDPRIVDLLLEHLDEVLALRDPASHERSLAKGEERRS
jgi:PAS domain S-box-containing protein/putative nucleotidyltransferase with HDIG domain